MKTVKDRTKMTDTTITHNTTHKTKTQTDTQTDPAQKQTGYKKITIKNEEPQVCFLCIYAMDALWLRCYLSILGP